jgi:RimJ/RimL family protein N-acetyltransferase
MGETIPIRPVRSEDALDWERMRQTLWPSEPGEHAWFADASLRGRGVGAALVAAAEEWGRSQGCTELASDTTIDNEGSAAAHRALGFEEVDRIICFRKPL